MFIPLKDDNPTLKFPYITIFLIVINVIVFIYQFSLGIGAERFIFRMGAVPYEITHFTDRPPYSPFPVQLSIFTSMFIHGDILHLLGNMLYLWIFGNNIEDSVGHFRFVIFYLLCGTAASFTHIILNINSLIPMVGASGAIAGILGAYLMLYPRARVLVLIWLLFFIRTVWIPSIIVLGLWFILQIYSAGLEGSGVAWFAHIGGFAAGFILIKFFEKGKKIGSYKVLE